MKKFNYRFDENTPPKEIINAALLEVFNVLEHEGFKFLKSKSEIVKKTEDFIFKLNWYGTKYNAKGVNCQVEIICSVSDRENNSYWGSWLATSNAKQDKVLYWQLYGEDNYNESLTDIISIVSSRVLPFFQRFETDLQGLVKDVSENGFCVFADKQIYDAGYRPPLSFLQKFGTKKQIELLLQNYIDRHELRFVKINLKNAIELIREGKEVTNNGGVSYAKFVVENNIDLKFN